MNIIYFKDPIGNFGDDLNEWLWDEVAPFIRELDNGYSLLGVGSIINKKIIKHEKVIVFGSGIGYGQLPTNQELTIKCVRGKLTAKLLNIDESQAISDSAILINLLPEFAPLPKEQRKGTLFIPHHNSVKYGNWQRVCDIAGATRYIRGNACRYYR